MRPIPAPRIGDSHGILRAIEERGRLRTDELVTEFSLEQLFPPELENALGRMRHFISYARAAGLVKEDRGVVELTEVGRRYVRAGDAAAPFDVSEQQAEWLRRQLREKHMTDSIFHGMAIALSLLASAPPDVRVSTLDFGRALAYLGRAGWDNENTLQIQGERYLVLLTDVELIDSGLRLTETGEQVRGELTLPVHMSLLDIAAQLNPGGADAVRAEAQAEWAGKEQADKPSETGYHDVVPGSYAPSATNGEGALPSAPPQAEEPELPSAPAEAEEPELPAEAAEREPATPAAGPPVPPDDIWDTAGPEDATRAIPAAQPPLVPRASEPETPSPPEPAEVPPSDPPAVDTPTVITPPRGEAAPAAGDEAAGAGAPGAAADDAVGAAGGLAGLADVARAAVPDAARAVPGAVPAAAGPPAADVAALGGAAAGSLAAGGLAPAPARGDLPAPGRAALAGSAGDLRGDVAAFVDPAAIRTAAEGAGLRFPDSVYANVAAGLGAGKHLLLTGAPGAGKTSLALAVARAAAQAGRANGAALVTASRDWAGHDVLVESAKRGRWVIVDELDRAQLDDALGGLSSFLAGLPVQLAGGDEATPEGGWRIVATAARVPQASSALLRRFAVVEVLPPAGQVLVEAINVAARGDATAAAAVARLLPLAEVAPLGAGVFIDAARHAAARHAAAPAIEATLARDIYAAYIAPLMGGLDADGARRVREIVGEG